VLVLLLQSFGGGVGGVHCRWQLALFIFSCISIEQGVEHFLCQRPRQSII
jgi:hypothetical protein